MYWKIQRMTGNLHCPSIFLLMVSCVCIHVCISICMCEQFWSSSHQIISSAYLYVASFLPVIDFMFFCMILLMRVVVVVICKREKLNLTLHPKSCLMRHANKTKWSKWPREEIHFGQYSKKIVWIRYLCGLVLVYLYIIHRLTFTIFLNTLISKIDFKCWSSFYFHLVHFLHHTQNIFSCHGKILKKFCWSLLSLHHAI